MSTDTLARYADFGAFAADLAVPLPGGSAPLGPRMAPFQRRDFAALTPALHALADGNMPPVRRFWLERTKGASKDTDCTVALLWLLAFASRAVRCQVIADDQQQALEVRLIVEAILAIDAPLNALLRQVVRVQRATVHSDRNGSTIEILTRDDSGSHGARPDLVLANELSHISDEGFASTVLDNADKLPTSVVIVATNAGFSDGWQYRWRQIAKTSDRWHFSAVTAPAPWISADDLAESQRRNPAIRFRRLWQGEWVRGIGDAFNADDIAAAVTMPGPMTGQEPGVLFGGAIDLGTKRDHSAVVILAADPQRRRVRLAWCQSWRPGPNGIDLTAVQSAVLHAHYRFQHCGFLVDPHQAVLMMQQLRVSGVPCLEKPFTVASLAEMATAMMQGFRERKIDLYHDADLLADLTRLNIQDRAFGLKLCAPADREFGHADRAIAMSMAMPAALKLAMTSAPTEPQPLRSASDPTWGAPVGAPGMYDSPYPDMRVEFPHRR